MDCWPKERFDPGFLGQSLETYYLDTANFNLRKARQGRERYLTLRIRTYSPLQLTPKPRDEVLRIPRVSYALSAKTEDQKLQTPLDRDTAIAILTGNFDTVAKQLPADLLARLPSPASSTTATPSKTTRTA